MLAHLADVSVRSLLLAVPAAFVLWLMRRRRTVALQHAVWTAVVCGMLTLFAFGQVLPHIPLRIPDRAAASIPAAPTAVVFDALSPASVSPQAFAPSAHPFDWLAAALYLYVAIAFGLFAQFIIGMFFVRRLLRSAGAVEPGIYESEMLTVPVTVAWLRPRIVLPLEWRNWDREKLNAVLAHEGTHVRRRDGLVAAFAHVNRCIFWFHPLAWFLERRLALLAELACDESCVASLGDPDRYAHLLLEMATVVDGSNRRLRHHALTMAAGSHIRQRIESLLHEGRTFSRGLTWTGWSAILLCGIPIVLGAGALQLDHRPVLVAQVASASPSKPLAFDVASVKPSPGDIMETRPTRSGGRFIWTTDLWYLTSYAYHLPFTRISGPIPGSASIFHVEATFDPAATEDQVRLMLRSLLQTRFKLVAHRVTKETDGYALSVAKNGLKMKVYKADDPAPPLPEWSRGASVAGFEGQIAATMPEANIVAITGRRVSISQLTETLQRMLPQMVWDQTGLTGNYYIAFRFARDDNLDVNAPTLATALRESLGLELKKQKGLVESLVVDSISKDPTEN